MRNTRVADADVPEEGMRHGDCVGGLRSWTYDNP